VNQPAFPEGMFLDSLEDLVASKMTALVERGAPRDFRDIHSLCLSGRCTMPQCWDLWQKRQELAGENTDRGRASLAIQTHLSRIEQARPLAAIQDAEHRAAAERLRTWFASEFIHGS
jgi:hypothetical protein